jgi:integrase
MHTAFPLPVPCKRAPWNKGRLIGQKRPLKPKDVWAIRVRLQLQGRKRDLALFNLAIDSKLRGCDLVRMQVEDVCAGGRVRDGGTVIQKKTGRPVQFEITEQTRASIHDWLSKVELRNGRYLFPSRFRAQPHLSTRQYARIVHALLLGAKIAEIERVIATFCGLPVIRGQWQRLMSYSDRRPKERAKDRHKFPPRRANCYTGLPDW